MIHIFDSVRIGRGHLSAASASNASAFASVTDSVVPTLSPQLHAIPPQLLSTLSASPSPSSKHSPEPGH